MVEMTEQQAVAKLKMNEQRLGQIQNQINSLGQAAEELKMTKATLTDLPTTGEKGFLPLGGAFIPVQTTEENVVITIGSRVVVEKTRDEAIEMLKRREESTISAIKKMQENGAKIRNESMIIQKKLQERAQQQPNVPVISG